MAGNSFARSGGRPAVAAAVGRAGADDVVARLDAGLDPQLGLTWPGGVEVSFGQWQKFALAWGFMREHPLLLVLDEPTAALDAETEHSLFERYAAAARTGRGPGGAREAEAGSHQALLAKGGSYAELYGIQAEAYRGQAANREVREEAGRVS